MKTGVAASRGGAAPRPVATLRLPGASDALLDALQRIAEEEEVTVRSSKRQKTPTFVLRSEAAARALPHAQELVVGLPLLYGPGGEARCTDQTAWAERFAGRMAARLPAARVWLVDESHSSSMAGDALRDSGAGEGRAAGLRDAVAGAKSGWGEGGASARAALRR